MPSNTVMSQATFLSKFTAEFQSNAGAAQMQALWNAAQSSPEFLALIALVGTNQITNGTPLEGTGSGVSQIFVDPTWLTLNPKTSQFNSSPFRMSIRPLQT